MSPSKRSGGATRVVLVLAAFVWCALVVYVNVSLKYLRVMDPLGRSTVAELTYSILGVDPMFGYRHKLDLPVVLIHAFGLFKCSQWLWRRYRPAHMPAHQ